MEEKQNKPTAAMWWKEYIEARAWEFLSPDQVNMLTHGVSPRWPENGNDELLVLGVDVNLGEQGFENIRRFLAETRPRWPQDLWFVDHIDFEKWEPPQPELAEGFAPPSVEFLEETPKIIRRPLSLIDGVAYAATWPWVRVRGKQSKNKKGEIIKHGPSTEQWLVIVRGDGSRFAKEEVEGMGSFADLGVVVNVPQSADPSRLWSTSGVNRYVQGHRPEAIGVFGRVADVVDYFIDFDRSLADQRTMAELVALYTMGTYFLDAFSVCGYLWSSGQYGVGKTQLLDTVCQMAYLGDLSMMGGSFAALRDLADMGACLGLDDAHKLKGSKNPGDEEKLALLLAGNHRGCTVPIKEWVGETKEWRLRRVSTFCPRMFSAIHLPDYGLGSRTITIPLIRTLDPHRGNAVVQDYTQWPHDRQDLVDDLWALALAHLPELPDIDREVGRRATLIGRALEPWRTILAMALWLDEDLFRKMEALSVSYQAERTNLEVADLTVLVVKALAFLYDPQEPVFERSTADIKAAAQQIAEDEEMWFAEKEGYLTKDKIGRVLGQLRLEAIKKMARTNKRGWRAHPTLLQKLAKTYGIPLSDSAPSDISAPSAPGSASGEIGGRGTSDTKGTRGTNKEGGTPEKKGNLGGVPLANVGKAQIDKSKLQEGLDAGLSQAAARESARVKPEEPLCLYPSHTKYWLRSDGSRVCAICHPPADEGIVIDGERIPF